MQALSRKFLKPSIVNSVLKREYIVVHVSCFTKPGDEDNFKQECIINGNQSIHEKGIVRFDVIQEKENKRHIVLNEVYYNEDAMKSHRATAHFQRFNAMCDKYLCEPRTRTVYESVCPEDSLWIAPVEKK